MKWVKFGGFHRGEVVICYITGLEMAVIVNMFCMCVCVSVCIVRQSYMHFISYSCWVIVILSMLLFSYQ